MRKRILILANSYKKGGRCIAGREIVEDGEHKRLGLWIRPISTAHEGGTLMPPEMRLRATSELAVGQVVDVELDGPASDAGQAENWVLTQPGVWRIERMAALDRAGLDRLTETPADLWHDPVVGSDRIRLEVQEARSPHCSLVIVQPEALRVRWWSGFNEERLAEARHQRAYLTYAGVEYQMSVTDPVFTAKVCTFPRVHPGEMHREITLNPATIRLLVSLTPPFAPKAGGVRYHYKVVATILGGY